ncbi:MAG: hypothetical protein K2X62_10715 [Beijerinckiaceae bacterium]|nr:hypothetical protein [Beijerinckiaceae bacterium]MDO9442554.1 DUF6352 family protein [Beijerinckiaceae bacterium]
MREFWVASGHHLTRRGRHGGLEVTPELLMAYLARPELLPPDEACDAERALHAGLMADPLRLVSPAEVAMLEDADARENWGFMLAFRERLLAAPSLEAAYLSFARTGAGNIPPIFLTQLCQLVLRNALDGCEDPYVLRAAEIFYRPQKATLHEGSLLLADAEVVEAQQQGARQSHLTPLAALLDEVPEFGDLDVMDDENAWTYWSRSDANTMIMNIGGNARARAGLASAIKLWIGHLLGVDVTVEPLATIEDRDWRWFVGLDSEGTKIGNALWNGAALGPSIAERVVTLMRLDFRDARTVDENLRGKPVYLIGAMDGENIWRMKPQNLVAGLPLAKGRDA